MAADYTDLLALMGDVLRAVDRQTEENKKAIDNLGNTVEQMGNRFEAIFNRFAEATADGFIRMEKKIDGVKQEVAGVKQEVAELRTDVQQIDQRLVRIEANQATQADMLHRLEILENIVLRKAS
jgi:chromosome segregation ATPase